MSSAEALRAGREEAARLGYPPIDDRIFYAYERALTEHPVLCPAVLPNPFAAYGTVADSHVHRCTHPARMPEGVTGQVVHRCACGTEWAAAS